MDDPRRRTVVVVPTSAVATPMDLTARWKTRDAALATLLLVVPLTLMSWCNRLLIAIRDGWLLKWMFYFGANFLTNAFVLFFIGTIVVIGERQAPPGGWRRIAALVMAVFVAALVSNVFFTIATELIFPGTWDDWSELRGLLSIYPRNTFLALAFCAMRELHRRLSTSIQATHRIEADRIVLDHEMDEARLQALQAQIEPHFLFNTLANLRRLLQTDRAAGRAMLANLTRVFEVALPHMRDAHSTLGRELSLADAFLQVHRIRMGRRLTHAIDAPAALASIEVPSMMLLTLVENAIKHGLNPLVQGGSIVVAARLERTTAGTSLIVDVTDDGRGFDPDGVGAGTGLANIRTRLATLRDPRATLSLVANKPHGVIASLSLPCDVVAATSASVASR